MPFGEYWLISSVGQMLSFFSLNGVTSQGPHQRFQSIASGTGCAGMWSQCLLPTVAQMTSLISPSSPFRASSPAHMKFNIPRRWKST